MLWDNYFIYLTLGMMFHELIGIRAYGIFYVPCPQLLRAHAFSPLIKKFLGWIQYSRTKTYTRHDVLPIRIHILRSGYVSIQFAPVGLNVMQRHKDGAIGFGPEALDGSIIAPEPFCYCIFFSKFCGESEDTRIRFVQ